MKALLFGDLSPTDVSAPYFNKSDVRVLFGDLLPLFQEKDLIFVNLECVLTQHNEKILKLGPPLKAPIEVANTLANVGVDVCGLSNNHIFDYGKNGVADTMDALRRAGIKYTGFGRNYNDSRQNYVHSKDSENVCIIAVCEHEYSYALEDRMGARPYDEYDTIDDIRKARQENDRVIVIYHGGKEQCRYPSPRLRKLCHAMCRAGADVILCQHSHCIGCYEEFENSHILYGQGNFHFVKPGFEKGLEGWNEGFAVVYDTISHEIDFIPFVTNECGIELAKGSEKTFIMETFEKRSSMLLDGSWKSGWHEFCVNMSDAYKGILSKVCVDENIELYDQFFGHYLDCEAHTDVFRELFQTYNKTNEK